jgi:hypothetical protein
MRSVVACMVLAVGGCASTVDPNTLLETTTSSTPDGNKQCAVTYRSGAERQIAGLVGNFCGNRLAMKSSASENSEAIAAADAADVRRLQLLSTSLGRLSAMAGAALLGGANPALIAKELAEAGAAIEGSVPAPAVEPEPETPDEDETPELPELPAMLSARDRPAPRVLDVLDRAPAPPRMRLYQQQAEPFDPGGFLVEGIGW